VKEAPQIISWH